MEPEVHLAVEAHHRLGLRLGGGGGATVGLVGDDRRRPLVVELPVLGVVAVGVDPVERRDPVVAVVVPQVLPPQAVVVERVLVAVGVGDHDEPQLGGLQQVDDLLPVLPVHLDEPLEQALVDLDADPLARVLQRAVEDRRPAVVGHGVGVGRQLERDDVAGCVGAVALRIGAVGLADHLELEQVRVGGRDLVEVRPDAVGPVVVLEDLEARALLLRGQVGRRDALRVGPRHQVDALLLERLALPGVQHQHDAHAVLGLLGRDDLVALPGEPVGGRRVDDRLVHLQPGVRGRLAARRSATSPLLCPDRAVQGGDERDREDVARDRTVSPHLFPLGRAPPRPTGGLDAVMQGKRTGGVAIGQVTLAPAGESVAADGHRRTS